MTSRAYPLHTFAALSCLWLVLTAGRASAINTLFTDTCTDSTLLSTNWAYGVSSDVTSVPTNDTFAIAGTGTNCGLVVTDASSFSYTTPVTIHSQSGKNFQTTGDKVLQLNAELTFSNTNVAYSIGLFDSTNSSTYTATANAIILKVFPALSSSNVTLYTTNSLGAVVSSVTTTVSTSYLLGTASASNSTTVGSHAYAIQVDYITTGTLTPTVRAYSNGRLLATLTYTASTSGINTLTSGSSQGTGIRVLVQGFSSSISGESFALANVAVKSYTPGSKIGEIRNSRSVNQYVRGGHNMLAASNIYGTDQIVYANGLWDNTNRRPDALVTAKLNSEIKVGMMRYPGGTMACDFNFKKTIGPLASRGTSHLSTSTFAAGLDECMYVIKSLGAEVMYTAPEYLQVSEGLPVHLANLVEYLNAPASAANYWGLQRAGNTSTYSSGYGVKYFELGNESYSGIEDFYANHNLGDAPTKYTPDAYVDYVIASSWAMRSIDPSVQLGAVALDFGNSVYSAWNRIVLAEAGPVVDFLIYHVYQPNISVTSEYYNDPDRLMDSAMAVGDQIGYQLQYTHDIITGLVGHDLPIAMTEYNNFIRVVYPSTTSEINYYRSHLSGLQCADMVRVFMKPENGLLASNFWQIVNDYFGVLQFSSRPTTAVTTYTEYPLYRMLALWGQHFGTTILNTTLSGPCRTFLNPPQGIFVCSGTTFTQQSGLIATTNLTPYLQDNIAGLNSMSCSTGTVTATLTGDTGLGSVLRIDLNNYSSYANGSGYGNWPQLVSVPDSSAAGGSPCVYSMSYDVMWTATSGTLVRPFWVTCFATLADKTSDTVNGFCDPITTSTWSYTEIPVPTQTATAAATFNAILNMIVSSSSPISGTLQIRNATLDTYKRAQYPAYSLLTCASSLSQDQKTAYMIVFNKGNIPIPTAIAFSGFTASSAKYWEVNAPNMHSKGGGVAKEVVSGATFTLIGTTGADYVFPPHSMTAIELTR